MKCDVRKEEDILSMMSTIKSQLGGADICVNNAGLGNNAPLLSGTTEQWREMLEVRVNFEALKMLKDPDNIFGGVRRLNIQVMAL